MLTIAIGSWTRYLLRHRNMDPPLSRRLLRQLISRIRMARHAHPRIVVQHARNPPRRIVGAIRHRDLPRVQRVAHAHAAAVMEAHPGRAGRRVQQRIQIGQSATASDRPASSPSRDKGWPPSRCRGDRGRSQPAPRSRPCAPGRSSPRPCARARRSPASRCAPAVPETRTGRAPAAASA